MMNELDKLALNQAKLNLSTIEGVTVLGDWVPVNVVHTIFMLPLQLELLSTLPANDVPLYSTWSIIIDFENDDKWGKVKIYPSLDQKSITKTYYHQQYNGSSHETFPVRNGDICTLSSIHGLSISKKALATEPQHTIERIIWHVERALDWLKAASTDTLSVTGDNFELPDFGIPNNNKSNCLGYYESGDNFNIWKSLSGQGGIASISTLNNTIIVRKYMNKNGQRIVYEPQWGSEIKKLPERKAIWLCLGQIPVINHWQVPSTFQELVEIASSQGMDLANVAKGILERFTDNSECLVLIGMPIPYTVNGEPFRYHWQGFSVPAATKIKSPTVRAQLVINHLRTPTPIKWFLQSENWHPDDLQNRGRVDKLLRQSEILLIGCGALGANIAEQLVRMGVSKMTVVDKELFASGNVVRHTLTINQINQSKAVELAKRLNQINPTATVDGIMSSVPGKNKSLQEVIGKADLVIDCSADDCVMSELPLLNLKQHAKIISCSTGMHADKLFFYADIANSFSDDEFNAWFQPFREQEHFLAQNEKLPQGAGCWNPVTPAKLSNIAGLASVSVGLIEQVVVENITETIALCHKWEVPRIKLLNKTKAA
jgi:hypothetical protein